MKASSAILAHIDRLYDCYLASPRFCASDPSAFEQILTQLEEIREFVLDVGSRGVERGASGYTQFLLHQGFGAKSFTTGKVGAVQGDNEELTVTLFNDMSRFWRQFLESSCRFNQSSV